MEKPLTKPSTDKVLVSSFAVNIIDIVSNGVVAIITGSAVLLSEMLQGFADFTASAFLLIGQKASKKPAGFDYPFGYGKEVYFWSLIATLVMFAFAAVGSIVRGYQQLVNPTPIAHVFWGIGVGFMSFVTNFYSMMLSYKKIRQRGTKFMHSYKASTHAAVKSAFISDLIGTLAAFFATVSLIAYYFTKQSFFDGLGAVIVGSTLAFLSIFLVREIKGYLVGKAAPLEIQHKIVHIVEGVKGVKQVMDLKSMYMGPHNLLINLEVNLDDSLVTDEVEKVIDKIRDDIHKTVPEASYIQIEAESPEMTVHLHEELDRKTNSKKNNDKKPKKP